MCSCLPAPACDEIMDENTCRLVEGCVPVFWDEYTPKYVAEDAPPTANFQCCTENEDGSVHCRGSQDECALAWLDENGVCRNGVDGIAPAYCCHTDTCMTDADCGPGLVCDVWNYCESRCGTSSVSSARCADVCYGKCVPPVDPCTRIDCGPGFECHSCPADVMCDVPYWCEPVDCRATGCGPGMACQEVAYRCAGVDGGQADGASDRCMGVDPVWQCVPVAEDCRVTGCGPGMACQEVSSGCGIVNADGGAAPDYCMPTSTWQCMPVMDDCRTLGCPAGYMCQDMGYDYCGGGPMEDDAKRAVYCGERYECVPMAEDCRVWGCPSGSVCENVSDSYCAHPADTDAGPSYCGNSWQCVFDPCAAVDCGPGFVCQQCDPNMNCLTTCVPVDCRNTGCMPGFTCEPFFGNGENCPMGDNADPAVPCVDPYVWACVPSDCRMTGCEPGYSCQEVIYNSCGVPMDDATGPVNCETTSTFQCMWDPCAGVDCAPGYQCQACAPYMDCVVQCVPQDPCAMLSEGECLLDHDMCEPLYATVCEGCPQDTYCARYAPECKNVYVGCVQNVVTDCRTVGCPPGASCQEFPFSGLPGSAWQCVPGDCRDIGCPENMACVEKPIYCMDGQDVDGDGIVEPCPPSTWMCEYVNDPCAAVDCGPGFICQVCPPNARCDSEVMCVPLDCRGMGCPDGMECVEEPIYCLDGQDQNGDGIADPCPPSMWICEDKNDPCANVKCEAGYVCMECPPNAFCDVPAFCVPNDCRVSGCGPGFSCKEQPVDCPPVVGNNDGVVDCGGVSSWMCIPDVNPCDSNTVCPAGYKCEPCGPNEDCVSKCMTM